MAGSIRKQIARLPDQELVNLNATAENVRVLVDYQYEKFGAVDVNTAMDASNKIELGLVARSVGRERMLNGGENSHRSLQNSSIEVSPKELDSKFGQRLRENRRV